MSAFAGLEHIVRENEVLAPYTWLRIGGAAQYFAEPTNPDEAAELVRRCRDNDIPVKLLGGGSNLLVREKGTPGLVLHLSAAPFGSVSVEGDQIIAGAGAKLSHVISVAVREGLAGIEQLIGIPGTIGGALRGNASTQSSQLGQWTAQATTLSSDGELSVRSKDDMRFSYRRCSLEDPVVLEVRFDLERQDPEQILKRMQTLWIVKKGTQPNGDTPAACLFRDQGGLDAATLIEQAGLKGAKIGGAEVSEQDANIITLEPEGTSDDVLRLIDLIRSGVSDRLGVELERAIEIW